MGDLELRHAALEQALRVVLEAIRVEPGEAEGRVRGGAQRQLAVERADEGREQTPSRPDERGHPRGREHVAERPDRTADVIADMRLVEPAAVVAHEVAHARSAVVGRVVEKRERAVEDRPTTTRSPVRRSSSSATTASRATSSTQ